MIDERLLEILACPRCRGPLEARDVRLVCRACAVAYPVEDGIPVLLVDEAVPLAGPTSPGKTEP